MDKLAAYLIEKETITGKEFMKIFNECKNITIDDSSEDESITDQNLEEIQNKSLVDESEKQVQTAKSKAADIDESSESEALHDKLEFMEETILPNTEAVKVSDDSEEK